MKINDLMSIIKNYDTLLIDLCGVLHDGNRVIEQANEKLQQLYDTGIKISFFSNSPRTIEDARAILTQYSVSHQNFLICTSGQFFLNEIAPKKADTFYILGVGKNYNLVEHIQNLGLHITSDLEEAQYLIILENAIGENVILQHDDLFQRAISLNIVALCPNPDQVALSGSNIVYPQGAFAARYIKLGGKVEFFGKPNEAFYTYTIDQVTQHYKQKPEKILAIGDNINTDVMGAINFGIDSVLITNGVYNLTHQNQAEIHPTYILQTFGQDEPRNS